MRLRLWRPCGVIRLVLRNANGLITGKDVRLAQASILPGDTYGYNPTPERSYRMYEYSPGLYEAYVEGGYLYDIYVDGILWQDFSPIYLANCSSPPTAIVTPPGIPAPSCDATPVVESTPVTLCWSASSGAWAYNLQVSSTILFNPGDIVVEADGIFGTCYTITAGISPPALYYWRVQAVSSGGTLSDWSNVCILDVRSALQPPTLNCISTIDETTPVTFDWSDVTNADTYDFQLSRNAAFTDLIVSVTGLVTSQYTFSGDLSAEGTTIYWRARAVNFFTTGPWSTTCTVTINPLFEIYAETSTTMSSRWRHYPTATTSYKLERIGPLNSDEFPYSPVSYRAVIDSPLGGGGTGNYTDLELLPGYGYTYKLTPQIGGVDQTPVLTASHDTNYDGAFDPQHVGYGGQVGGLGMNETTGLLGGAAAIQPFPQYGTYYGGGFNHITFTVDFEFKNTGTESGTKAIWERDCIESWGVGSILTTLGIYKTDTTLSLLVYQIGLGTHSFTVSAPMELNQRHHWAVAYSMNQGGGGTSHSIYVYKDAVLTDTFTWTTTSRHRFIFVGGVSLYLYRTTFILMDGIKGILDEFRVWSQTLSDTTIAAIKDKTIRSNAALLYRFGFDNYSRAGGNAEFDVNYFGRLIIDPQHNDGVTITDRAGLTAAGGSANLKHMGEPLLAQDLGVSPPVPVLISPANGAVADLQSLTFTWISVLATHDEIQIATDSGFTNIVYSNTNVTGQKLVYSSTPLLANTTYYWRVRAVNGANVSAYSTTFSFVMNFYVTLNLTPDGASFADEPFDAWEQLNLTHETVSAADEPFDAWVTLNLTKSTYTITDV